MQRPNPGQLGYDLAKLLLYLGKYSNSFLYKTLKILVEYYQKNLSGQIERLKQRRIAYPDLIIPDFFRQGSSEDKEDELDDWVVLSTETDDLPRKNQKKDLKDHQEDIFVDCREYPDIHQESVEEKIYKHETDNLDRNQFEESPDLIDFTLFNNGTNNPTHMTFPIGTNTATTTTTKDPQIFNWSNSPSIKTKLTEPLEPIDREDPKLMRPISPFNSSPIQLDLTGVNPTEPDRLTNPIISPELHVVSPENHRTENKESDKDLTSNLLYPNCSKTSEQRPSSDSAYFTPVGSCTMPPESALFYKSGLNEEGVAWLLENLSLLDQTISRLEREFTNKADSNNKSDQDNQKDSDFE